MLKHNSTSRMKNILFILIIFSVAFVLAGSSHAAVVNNNLYVATNGSDSNNGSMDHPWKTINYAASQVNPGDTVIIADGTYSVDETIQITTSGTPTSPISFTGSGKTIIDGSLLDGSAYYKRDIFLVDNANYINLENLEIKNAFRAGIRVSQSDYVSIKKVISHDNGNWGIFTDFSNYVLIENCECYGSKNEHGIYVSNSGDNPTIRGNKIHDNKGCGLHMNGDASMGGDGIISGALVEDNIIYNNGIGGGSGINCDGVINSIIRNNLIYNNYSSGISLYCIDGGSASVGNSVYHNTVIVASNGRWALNLKGGSSQNKIYNNILLNDNPAHGSINTDSISGLQCDYNILTTNSNPVTPDDDGSYPTLTQWQALGFDQHSARATKTELFTNASLNDYTLKKDSPAIDKGNSVYTCSSDIAGNNRPQGAGYDVGAYEYLTEDLTPPKILTIDPTNNTVNVPSTKIITVTFSESVKAGSNFWVALENSNGTLIPIGKSIVDNVLTVTPTSALAESKYKLILHTGSLTDLAGNKLALCGSYFITGSSPHVTSSDPANNAVNVPRDKVIKIIFNESIKKLGNCWVDLKASNGTLIPITTSVNGSILTITHTSLLTANTPYSMILHTGCLSDLAGNPLGITTIKFNTSTDNISPTLSNSDPTNNAVDVAKDKVITVNFNENVKAGSNFWVELKVSNGTAVTVDKSITNNVLTITHATLLAANTSYSLILHTGCVTDLAGNPLALKTISFTTGTT